MVTRGPSGRRLGLGRGDRFAAQGHLGNVGEVQSAAAYAVELHICHFWKSRWLAREVQSAAAYAVEVAFPCLLRRSGTRRGTGRGPMGRDPVPLGVPLRLSRPGRATSTAYAAADCTSRASHRDFQK